MFWERKGKRKGICFVLGNKSNFPERLSGFPRAAVEDWLEGELADCPGSLRWAKSPGLGRRLSGELSEKTSWDEARNGLSKTHFRHP